MVGNPARSQGPRNGVNRSSHGVGDPTACTPTAYCLRRQCGEHRSDQHVMVSEEGVAPARSIVLRGTDLIKLARRTTRAARRCRSGSLLQLRWRRRSGPAEPAADKGWSQVSVVWRCWPDVVPGSTQVGTCLCDRRYELLGDRDLPRETRRPHRCRNAHHSRRSDFGQLRPLASTESRRAASETVVAMGHMAIHTGIPAKRPLRGTVPVPG